MRSATAPTMSQGRRGSPRPDSSPSRRTYSRGGRARCIARVFRELLTQRGRALEDIFAARDHVQSMPECTGSVGVVGFRMGLTRIGDGAQGFWRFGTVLLPAAATPPQ